MPTNTPPLSILMYHQVGRFAAMRTHRANYCDAGRFARQMAFLDAAGFRVLDIDSALACLRGEQSMPARAVVLTFDDAYVNFIEHALPVLRRHGFPAVVYAISAWLGRRMNWARPEPGRPQPQLMTAAQLLEIRAAGITVGSHGATHAKLGELEPDAQRRELADSRAALEDALGEAVEHLCYPFGSFDRSAVTLAAEIGYRSATTCLRGAATPRDHPLVLPRKAISYGDNLIGYGWKLLIKHAPKPVLGDWRERMASSS
jgi:peptidoglycan/xylan/chitin deacetylase (PgdA/CDA1 family)